MPSRRQILQIHSSLFAGAGQSTRLTQQFIDNWRVHHPHDHITVRDLAAAPIPHLDAERLTALNTPIAERTEDQQHVVDESNILIDELDAADVVVLGLPMYNFGIPSQLKAYFDHIARSGVTFRYTANGPEGFLTGKKVYVLAARGGMYSGTPDDNQTAWVRQFLGFLGMTDIEFVFAEGLNMDPDRKQVALAEAGDRIASLAA